MTPRLTVRLYGAPDSINVPDSVTYGGADTTQVIPFWLPYTSVRIRPISEQVPEPPPWWQSPALVWAALVLVAVALLAAERRAAVRDGGEDGEAHP